MHAHLLISVREVATTRKLDRFRVGPGIDYGCWKVCELVMSDVQWSMPLNPPTSPCSNVAAIHSRGQKPRRATHKRLRVPRSSRAAFAFLPAKIFRQRTSRSTTANSAAAESQVLPSSQPSHAGIHGLALVSPSPRERGRSCSRLTRRLIGRDGQLGCLFVAGKQNA
jgi:hypothetical protein